MVLVLGCGEKTDSSVSEAVHTVESEKDLPAQPTSSPTTVEVTDPTPNPTQISSPEIQVLSVRVIETLPHDSDAFTQGLEFSQGRLFESRGLYGKSGISEINPNNGELIRWLPFDDVYFGEGITVVADKVIQLTWTNEIAFVFDLDSFELLETFSYQGQGWGLCYNGDSLYMSDGSSWLTVRNPDTFTIEDEVAVTKNGIPVEAINELECVDEEIYANVWRTNEILVIDQLTGNVIAVIDASGLLTGEESETADVLNGIAYIEQTGTFLITGKLWPSMFEVSFE